MNQTHIKTDPNAPSGFFRTEAAGLRWLARAGGASVVPVIEVDEKRLVLRRLEQARPDAAAAGHFGEQLARTHAAGAPAFGALPPDGQAYWFGPLDQPLQLPALQSQSFGEFYAGSRLRPVTQMCLQAGAIDALLAGRVDRVCRRLEAGDWDTRPGGRPVGVSRIHGDLWSGNLVWTPEGATLIDPAACGGDAEADLAMLALFGAPHLAQIRAGYEREAPLAAGWRERIALHQLFPLLVHVLLFGGAFTSPTNSALDSLLGQA